LSRIKSDGFDDPLYGGNPLRFRIAEDATAIYQDFKLVVSMLHLRLDAVLGFEFALQAPGQASQTGSYQTAANFNLHVAPLAFRPTIQLSS
jgi:hypothetical protein